MKTTRTNQRKNKNVLKKQLLKAYLEGLEIVISNTKENHDLLIKYLDIIRDLTTGEKNA